MTIRRYLLERIGPVPDGIVVQADEYLFTMSAVLALLAESLDRQLRICEIDSRTRDAVLKYTRACAEQLRLVLDGGWSWETVQTEWAIYVVTHPDAPWSHRAFKSLTLAAALTVTPRIFYGAQKRIARSNLYRRARNRWLPIPEMLHIKKDPQTGP
jgi:hypothetical protein